MWIKIAPCILALALLLTPVSAVEDGGEETQDPGVVDAVVEVLDNGALMMVLRRRRRFLRTPLGPPNWIIW